MPMLALLLLVAVSNAKRFSPPRQELDVHNGPSALQQALQYPCDADHSQTCEGIPHIEALFGTVSYGERKILNLYDGSPTPGMTGCPPVTYNTAKYAKPFVLLIDRGVCHFTDKVRAAEDAGADAVIIVDNVALSREPLCVCPDFSTPLDKDGRKCMAAAEHSGECFCNGVQECVAIPSTPTCDKGFPTYQKSCDSASKLTGGCWKCGANADGVSIYFNADCNKQDDATHCVSHYYLPFMADDGYGGDITIPSVMISDYHGAQLRMGMKVYAPTGPLVMKMEWNLPLLTNANLELWTSCEDDAGADFKLDFKETMLRLSSHLTFTPRYYIFDGHALKCDSKYNCGTQCVSNGAYCGRDPDGAMGTGVEGKDVVMENLRQLCIWSSLNAKLKADPAVGRVELMKWWCYVNDFSDQCFDTKGIAMESSENFAQCSNDVMTLHDIDTASVQACVDKSFLHRGDPKKETNTLLAQEITDRKEYAILTLPTAIVNGRELRGSTSSGATMEANVARAVCQGYQTLPVECDRILNPAGAGSPESGELGMLNFKTTLSYTSKSPPTLTPESYSLNKALQHRFVSALALKTGADPKSLSFEQAVDGTDPNTIIVGVKLSNLKCDADATDTESVKDALKKIADCGEDLGDGGEDEAEKELEQMQTFNVHSGDVNVLTVTISKVTEDKTLCDSPPSNIDGGGDATGTFNPSADQIDPGSKDVVPACCSEDPASECCAAWRNTFENKEAGASTGYGGGSMALMFFVGMFAAAAVAVGAVFFMRRRQMGRDSDNSTGPMFSSSAGGSSASEADYSAL
jgi:hypothetical protein